MQIRFIPKSVVPEATLAQHKRLMADYPGPPMASTEKLAVVGGGPSATNHIEALRAFDGDVWAINGAYHWCLDAGVEATLFTIDPVYMGGASKAILADICDPRLADMCDEVFVQPLDGVARGSTSATAAPHIAVLLGYREIHFFGCEGSFGETTHTFKNIDGSRLLIRSNGKDWLTNPQMLMQCEVLSEMIRMAPHVFIERSGGLLRAMINDPDYDAIAGSREIHEAMSNGDQNVK